MRCPAEMCLPQLPVHLLRQPPCFIGSHWHTHHLVIAIQPLHTSTTSTHSHTDSYTHRLPPDTSSPAGAWNSIVKAVSKFFKKPPEALLQLFDVQAMLRDPGLTPEEMLQAKPAAIPSRAAVLDAGRQDPHLQLQAELFGKRFELQADLMSELYVSCWAWDGSALGMPRAGQNPIMLCRFATDCVGRLPDVA